LKEHIYCTLAFFSASEGLARRAGICVCKEHHVGKLGKLACLKLKQRIQALELVSEPQKSRL